MSAALAPTASAARPWRCVSIDVEEYFHIEAAVGTLTRADWDHWPSRVQRNVELLLELFARCDRRGTFFILGHVAQRHPSIVRAIAAAGHEIASHGHGHDRLHRLDPASFRDDLLTSKRLLEDHAQTPVIGYRAPTFSLVPRTAWAIDVLLESGFAYDASIFPVRHPWYGVPAAPDRPFMVQRSAESPAILEVPPLTWRCAGRKLAVAGGGYFRLLPLAFMRRGLAQSAREQRPAVLYFHPWEFDPDMPRMPLRFTGRLRTYTGLKRAAARLESILRADADWTPIAARLDRLRAVAQSQPPFVLQASATDERSPTGQRIN